MLRSRRSLPDGKIGVSGRSGSQKRGIQRLISMVLARIIHIEVNNLPSGLRLRPAFAGRRSGLALSPAAAAGRIIHEDTPFVNNAG